MQKAKAFFFVCAGMFLLAMSYHLGAKSATAQAGATGFGFAVDGPTGVHCVMTPNGDVYARFASQLGPYGQEAPTYMGNFWGGATAATSTTWGKVKADYRK